MATPYRNLSAKRNLQTKRIISTSEIILDNANAVKTGTWEQSQFSPGFTGENYDFSNTNNSSLKWTPSISQKGVYSVFVKHPDGTLNRDRFAKYSINHIGGVSTVAVDQRNRGGQWVYIGTYPFNLGKTEGFVEIKHSQGTGITVADSVRFLLEKEKSYDGELIITANAISDGTILIGIEDKVPNDNTSYWLERLNVSSGTIQGFIVPWGTDQILDNHNLNSGETTYKYRIRKLFTSSFRSESTVTKNATLTKSSEILIPVTGYKANSDKKFFVKNTVGTNSFNLINTVDGTNVLTNQPLTQVTDTISGSLLQGDFSNVSTEGYYKIVTDNGLNSIMFPIGDIYDEVARATMSNLYFNRWGADKVAKRIDTGAEMQIGYGWEDAWDFKHWTSYNDTIQPFVLLEMLDNNVNAPNIEEELRWGLNYLLNIQERNPGGSGQMKFGQIIAAYTAYANGGVPANTIMVENVDVDGLGGYSKVCEHVIAHFLYVFVLAKSARYYTDKDVTYSNRLKTQALDAYNYITQYDEVERVKYAESVSTGDYFRAFPVLNYCYKVMASIELYRLLGNEQYLTTAKTYMNKVVQCQNRDFSNNSAKLTGYFMKDENKDMVLRNRIHAGIPLFTLSRVVSDLSQSTNAEWFKWYSAMKIYLECYVKKFVESNAYKILPYGFGVGPRKMNQADTLNYRFFQGYESSGNEGESDGNTKMSALFAASLFESAIVTGDNDLIEIAYRHLEWIFGKNHFGLPLVLGIGELKPDRTKVYTHGYEPDSFEAIGAAVNGIDGLKETDAPYWNNSWRTGETWGINRSWIQMAVASLRRLENQPVNTSQLSIESIVSSNENVAISTPFTVTVRIKNNGNTGTFPVSIYSENATNSTTTNSITINSGATATLTLNLTSSVIEEPYVVAVMLNNERKNVKSIVGYVE